MNTIDFVLKILSLIDTPLSAIQIQKLFFLLEKRLGQEATYFKFKPYFYGPYDKNLTDIINEAVKNNKIELSVVNGVDYYKIDKNYIQDTAYFFDTNKREFIKNLTTFIKQKKFKELCFAIYDEFPEMKVNSVFNLNKL